MDKKERYRKAKLLKEQGFGWTEISRIIDTPKTTITNWLCPNEIKRRKSVRRLEVQRKYDKKYCKTPQRKISLILRSITTSALTRQNIKKSARSEELLGCSIEEARIHIEQLFEPGMSWENHGEWHIDHIRPCCTFDLANADEQRQCCHYTNLQPLWAADNLSKGSKYNG